MILTSATFAQLLDTAPSCLHLMLSDGSEVPREAIRSAKWSGGCNAGEDITLGSTVANHLEIELDSTKLGNLALTDAMLAATLTLDGAEDEIPCGVLQVDDIDSDDDTVTLSAGDAMLFAFSAPYGLDDTALGLDWEAGVDGLALLNLICDACGVPLGTTELPSITLQHVNAAGYTYREIIAFLACMWGCFARMDGVGQLIMSWYAVVERPVAADRYYDGELRKADYDYTVGYIKCYVEPLEETLSAGDTEKAQGIYIQCPWMTQERLEAVWATVGGFSYRPVSGLRFLGDPRLEPGDVIQVTDRSGVTYTVPCMTLQHEYDGGLITEVTAVGKSVSKSEHDYEGPVTRAIKRAEQNIKASIIKYQDEINAKVEATDGRASQALQKVDSIKLSVSDPIVGTNGSYVSLELIVGGVTQSLGMVKIDGNVDISGQLSAEALYAIMGDIAMLTVNSLSTSRRIPLYLARDKSDDNYIRIEGRDMALMRAWTDGSTEQAKAPNGALLYWETDVSDATLGDDGYPYIDGSRVFTTTEETDYPVYVYVYEEGYRLRITFDEANSFGPRMGWGEGDGTSSGNGRGYLEKLGLSFDIYNQGTDGVKRGVFMGNEYVDIVGERLPTKMVSSGNTLTVTYQGDVTRTFTFTEDSEGNVAAVTVDGHTIALEGF